MLGEVIQSGQGKSQTLHCTTTTEAQETGGGWVMSDHSCDAKKLKSWKKEMAVDGKKGMVVRNI